MTEPMTVTDRLAEKIKGSAFADWFGDADLREIIGKALDKAFFTERKTGTSYHDKTLPPLIVEVATAYVRTAVDARVVELLKERLAVEPELIERAIAKAMEASLEQMIQRVIFGALSNGLYNLQHTTVEHVRSLLANSDR